MKIFCTIAFRNLKWDIQIASDQFGTLRINFDKDLVTKERERERGKEKELKQHKLNWSHD